MSRLPSYLRVHSRPAQPWRWSLGLGGAQLVLGAALVGWPQLVPQPVNAALEAWHLPPPLVLLVLLSLFAAALGYALGHDLSRRQREAARAVRRLFDVIDQLPEPTAVRDAQGRFVLWNRAAEARYGLTFRHAEGKTPALLFPPAFVQQMVEVEQRALEAGEPVLQRIEVPAAYGCSASQAVIRMAPLLSRSKPQRLLGIVSTVTDLSALEQVAREAQLQHMQLDLALEACHAGAWGYDLETRSSHYDAAYARLLAWDGPLDAFHTEYNFYERLHPEDRTAVMAAELACLKQGEALTLRYRLRCFDGVERRFIGRARVVEDAQGGKRLAGLMMPDG
jgi:PAS domain S-box-containing protein